MTGSNAETPATVRELPPPPGGATLVLSGLLTAGAWQLLRSARQWHFGALPEWYHDACPDQIGHAVRAPYSLDRSLKALHAHGLLLICVFEAPPPASEPCPILHNQPREILARLRSQFSIPTTAPRGPPANT